MFDWERKRDEDLQRSEAVRHFKNEEDMTAEKAPDGYLPHWSERDEQTRPREMFSMGNSYGNVSVAANRNQEMTLFVGENRRHNSGTLDNDHKWLNGERRHSVNDPFGKAYSNVFDPVNSAFAFKTGKLQPAGKVLERIKKYVEEKGQNTVENILPFFTLEREKKKLQALAAAARRAKEEGRDASELEREKELLSLAIGQKEQMQSQFLRKMRLALIKAKVLTDAGDSERLTAAVLPAGLDSSGPPPGDEEEILVEGLLNTVRGKEPGL
jgi:hypothetical protein